MRPRWFAFCKSALASVVLGTGLAASDALPQSYPEKPVRIVLGFPPGGAVDFIGRLVGQKLSENMSQPVVIENRPGAATSIAAERVAKAPPDGYTLLLIPISTAVQAGARTNLPYDLKRDIAAVSQIASGPLLLLVHPSLPARSLNDLMALARARPGKLEWATPGIASANHLAGELMLLQTKIKMLHVPFKGSSEAVVATASGQVGICFSSLAAAQPMLNSGRLRPIAFSTATRVAALPDIPTIAESGVPGFEYSTWYGLATPAGTPKDIIGRLNTELGRIGKAADVRSAFDKQGLVPATGTPEQFAVLIDRTIQQTIALSKSVGLKLD
jgi:tripartite-type tricarboxylate transporter receptor subunit TctC